MSVFDTISNFIFGTSGGLTYKDLSVERHKFSDLLPYLAYNEKDEFYYLKDNSVGWIFECMPLIFAGGAMQSLSSIFKVPLPDNSAVQTVLYADPYIEDILGEYTNIRTTNPNLDEIYKAQVDEFCEFFRSGAKKGLDQLSGTPIRAFRLYVSVKIPVVAKLDKNREAFFSEVEKYKVYASDIQSLLISAKLSPAKINPNRFLSLLGRIFNPDLEPVTKIWDGDRPLNKQIINGETEIERDSFSMKFGNTYARCLTPKRLPSEIDSSLINNMLGFFGIGSQSSDDDMNQIKAPFIFTSIFVYGNLNNYLDFRASQVRIQRASGNFAQGIALRQNEMEWMNKVRQENGGDIFLRVLVQLWIFDKNEERLSDIVNRVSSIWTNLNIESQKEHSFILPKLFVSALPLGLYGNDFRDLERDFIMPSVSAAHLMTIQAGCNGIGKPYMLFMDRRAQLVSLDILDTGANKNFLVTGGTGGGKSFFLNYLVNSYRSAGSRVRIIDVGRSYEKMANMFGGQFIQFAGSDIVLNFFEGIGDIKDDSTDAEKQEDYADKMSMLTGVVATMIAKTETPATSKQITLIENAIRDVYKIKKGDTCIDDIANHLAVLPSEETRMQELASEGYYISQALKKYCKDGEYGRFFHGKSNVSFNNNLVVIELDGVSPEFRKVVILAFASMIEDEIYNGDRKTSTIVVIDEAWQMLSENPAAAKFSEGLYRKIRKYNGSVGIATQSVADTALTGKLGQLGVTIRGQSNMHFILPDNGFITAKKESLLDFTEFEWNMLVNKLPSKSLPRYSEFIVKSDKFVAAARLSVDAFTYFVCSSDADDNTFLTFWSKKYRKEDQSLSHAQSMKLAIQKAVDISNEIGGIGNFRHYIKTTFKQQMSKGAL